MSILHEQKISKLFSTVLAGSLVLGAFPGTVNAATVVDEANDDVNISFETTIVFTEEQGQLYKEAMEKDVKETIEALTNEVMMSDNAYKEEYIESLIKDLNEANVEDVFDDETCTTMTIPMMNTGIAVDGEVEKTDLEGVITVDEAVSNEIIERFDNDDNYDVTVENDTVVVSNQVSFDDFAEGIYNMSEEMSDTEGQAVTTYSKKSKGYSWGSNASRTVVCYSTNSYPNIVYCNKCDKSSNESKSVAAWAVGGSDCAKSVRLGGLALSGGIFGILYSNSIYCVIESCASVYDALENTSTSNIYCNGKKKSGNHWNCSWFTGIGHTESFHTH